MQSRRTGAAARPRPRPQPGASVEPDGNAHLRFRTRVPRNSAPIPRPPLPRRARAPPGRPAEPSTPDLLRGRARRSAPNPVLAGVLDPVDPPAPLLAIVHLEGDGRLEKALPAAQPESLPILRRNEQHPARPEEHQSRKSGRAAQENRPSGRPNAQSETIHDRICRDPARASQCEPEHQGGKRAVCVERPPRNQPPLRSRGQVERGSPRRVGLDAVNAILRSMQQQGSAPLLHACQWP
jgi:hypothetical protein